MYVYSINISRNEFEQLSALQGHLLLVFGGLAVAKYRFLKVEVSRILTLQGFKLVELPKQGPHERVLIVKFENVVQVKEGLVQVLP